ncbi:hypothetical protein L2E82_26957 [Cichorium intybus]|uniref:Uncharacterized protein n=1 Tax=Cichorium intybus TaxID=13427 RepID=A0ACB9CRS2_CICIN|nr:hypothetical protein L2E82_26957 [Cichorium intybus]
MIRTLADASNDRRSLSAQQIICTVIGFLLTVTTFFGVTVYAKRRLSKLQKEEEKPLIQQFYQFKEMERRLHPEAEEALKRLSDDPKTTVVILSGTHHSVLDKNSM